MPKYEKAEHTIAFIHFVVDEGIGREVEERDLSETDTRRLRAWVEQNLRIDDCKPARTLYKILNAAVHQQAVEQGYSDAVEFGESRLHSIAAGVWRAGYELGFATGMSERFEEAASN